MFLTKTFNRFLTQKNPPNILRRVRLFTLVPYRAKPNFSNTGFFLVAFEYAHKFSRPFHCLDKIASLLCAPFFCS